ncbi:hypothetical protein I862_03845 [endosymbiont of Acanthamoeba sp. UWC8]|nr:hypothetical protein I862_03845 [endosymbiont of Acanthamoeba sp. UWC8]
MIKKMILPAMALLLAGCNTIQENNIKTPAINQETAYKPGFIVLDVKDIVIIDRTDNTNSIGSNYKPPINPKQAIINWAEKRLRAKGSVGKIEVVIKEASFKEEKLKNETGQIIESLRRGEHNKYDARYLISMKLYSDEAARNKVSEIEIEAFSTRNVEGVISSEDKNLIITKMLQELLDNAEQQLEYNIATYFIGAE